MTTQVKQVPKRPETKVKIEPKRETTPEPSASSGMGIANIYAGDVADSTNVDPNNSSANPVDNLWVNYKGTGQDVRDEPAGEHQTVEISGHQVRFPPPPAKNTSKLPSSKRATSQNVKVLKKPVLRAQDIPDQHAQDDSYAHDRFARSDSSAYGSEGTEKGKSKEGKSQDLGKSKGSGKSKDSGKGKDYDLW